MTTPMVDTVRHIPLIVEKSESMVVDDDDDSGFPFDRVNSRGGGGGSGDEDDSFRSQLDDLAKRHPEFAEHLDGFPFRSRLRPSTHDEDQRSRFSRRPFGQRFADFGFPFDRRDPFDESGFHQQQQQPHPTQESSECATGLPTQQHNQQQQTEDKQTQTPPPSPSTNSEKSERKQQTIQQSNTVDLGRKQEPEVDESSRNQRSMSAPPSDNRRRFVSSINIPINREGVDKNESSVGGGEMGAQHSQPPPQQQQQTNKPVERIIPIVLEDRNETVMPKNVGATGAGPERIFGHMPNQFTQFVGRQTPPKPTQSQQVPPPQQQQAPIPTPPPEKPQQTSVPQPQQPPTKATSPIDVIQAIQKDVSELMGQVEKFDGAPKDKKYLYLDEMLTRNLIKLDNIDTQGQENIRQARKEAIKCIESCIGILEAKAAANVQQKLNEGHKEEQQMDVEIGEKKEEEKMEVVEASPRPQEEIEKNEENKMETTEATSNQNQQEQIPPPPLQNQENTKEEEKGKDKIVEETKK